MASSDLLGNVTGLQIVPYEHSPTIITLIKVTQSRGDDQTHEEDCVMSDDSDQPDFSLKLPKDYAVGIFGEDQEGSTKNSSWSRHIDFRIPDDCEDYILAKDEAANVAGGEDRILLQDRLEGWQIERRPREKTHRFDKYFHHRKSSKQFRSFVEVQDFIVRSHTRKVRKPSEIIEDKKRVVGKFFEEAWNNLMNSGKRNENFRDSTRKAKEPKIMKEDDAVEIQEMIDEYLRREPGSVEPQGNI